MVNYPKDWETVELNKKYRRVSGTPITAEMMANIASVRGNIAVYAGGSTKIKTKSDCIKNSNIINDEVVIVQSRGIIDFIFSDKPCTFKNEFWGYIGDKNNSVKFLYYLLKNNVAYFRIAGEGRSSFSQITNSVTENYIIPNISTTEQQAIADALTAFDTHINNLSKLTEKKKMIRDGAVEDLVSGKRRLAGFSGEWEECELNKIADIFDGTHQTPKYTLTGVPFVSVENITNLYDTDKFISESDFELEFKNIPEKGDILMTRIGDIGTVSIVTRKSKLAYYVSLALFKRIKICSEFLLYYMRSSAFQKELFDRSLNFAIPKKINKGEIGKCNVYFPTNMAEQQAIADILTAMDEEINDLEEEKGKYIALKAGAMNDLLTGKIRLV